MLSIQVQTVNQDFRKSKTTKNNLLEDKKQGC